MKRDFLHITDFSTAEIWEVFELTKKLKKYLKEGREYTPLKGKTMAMIFAKPSARTRISFETGMTQLGGHAIYLGPNDIGIGQREAIKDIAQVIARYDDLIMARLFAHAHILELAEYSSVPVINGLTDYNHPCQVMADIFTVLENRGNLDNLKVTFVGDGNNVVNSWLELTLRLPMHFVLACPPGYEPDQEFLTKAQNSGISKVEISHEPFEAVKNADVIYTDVWTSMGRESELEKRQRDFAGFQVNMKLVKAAKPNVFVMHCLPAHRGEEISDEVIDGPNSIVFDEAENRMHVQKAIIHKLMVR
ncbi:MAG TPA: ornithine carbamoyltransferase [Candidatus Marinimicrobia bacterium]|nr:ornithine carbamoyltransferase [Candidatus Neomarinimicrobiota bacterium]HRS51906.1 ornithine carbamoyltransferase [Candidatus Neomarinimicrobiota bacterium]HRU93306.1 ornithine carbamoyltransferase [Candidatus Neomarinimicrobiota bacterium]